MAPPATTKIRHYADPCSKSADLVPKPWKYTSYMKNLTDPLTSKARDAVDGNRCHRTLKTLFSHASHEVRGNFWNGIFIYNFTPFRLFSSVLERNAFMWDPRFVDNFLNDFRQYQKKVWLSAYFHASITFHTSLALDPNTTFMSSAKDSASRASIKFKRLDICR